VPLAADTPTDTNALPRLLDNVAVRPVVPLESYQIQLNLAHQQRISLEYKLAEKTLRALLLGEAPEDIKRQALFEMAVVTQESGDFGRAQQIYSQYLHRYPKDPATPEVLLRQGLLYRELGIHQLAVAKFFAVMNTALNLSLDRFDYYKRLVLQSQIEIAETYYRAGQFPEAIEFQSRLLKQDSPDLNRAEIHYKFIRSLAAVGQQERTVGEAESFLRSFPDSADVPEVRFLCAQALKRLGRNNDAMNQVLVLLESQQASAKTNPQNWIYWQQRAGNEIANQLYQEGDYMSALSIYLSLSALNNSVGWQIPVWYQIGLVYEHLEQPAKAEETYARITAREPELVGSADSANFKAIVSMAKWRSDYLRWRTLAEVRQSAVTSGSITNLLPMAAQ
jgi:tetratricopeptide (TPR) repeat protein